MPELVVDERIHDTALITGTGDYTPLGAPTGKQPVSVIGATNYSMLFVTDDINWEVGLYTYQTGPNRLVRTHVVKSSSGGSPVNWNNASVKIKSGLPAWLMNRAVSKSVAGGVNVTLTALEQRCNQLTLTGALTANIEVIVDTTKWSWTVFNNTTGAYTVTLKTASGSGVAVGQGKTSMVICDGTDVKDISAAGSVPTGTILEFGGTVAPAGYLLRDGSNVSRTTYAALFAAIGTTWGVGDGSTTFGVGDDRRKVAVGAGGTGTGTLGNAVGNSGGAETHALVLAENAPHTHAQQGDTFIVNGAGVYGTGGAGPSGQGGGTTGSSGSGTAHNNMQPSNVVLKIIKT